MTTDDHLPDAVRPPSGWKDRLRRFWGEPASSRRVLVRNGLWETSSFAVHALVMFFLSPFIVHRLGSSLYGVWEMVIALTGYLNFADLGVRPAAVHFIARYDAKQDDLALNRFVNTAFVSFAAAGALVLLLMGPLAWLLPRFWRIAPGFETEAQVALLLVAGELALTLPLNAFSAVLVGRQRYDLLGRVRLVMLVVKTGGIVTVLSQGWGLVALAAVVAGTSLVQMLWLTLVAFRTTPALRFAPRLATRQAFRGLLRFGGWATVVLVAYQITWATDPLVIGRALSDVHVAWFAIGFKLAAYAKQLLYAASRVAEPATGALFGRGDKEGILRLLSRGVRLMLLLAAPILVYLLVLGRPFLQRWMGPEFAERSAAVLGIMTIAVLPAIASGPIAAAHYGINRVRPLALLLLLEAALNLVLSVLLVGPWGLAGVAIGTAVPAYLVHAVLLPWTLCRHYDLSWWTFLKATWLGPCAAGGLAYVGLRLVADPSASYGWPSLLAFACVSVGLFLAAAILLGRLLPSLFADEPLLRLGRSVQPTDAEDAS